LLLVAAIVVTSRYAGTAAGLVVVLASVLGFDWFFDSTPRVLEFTAGSVLRAAAFGFVALLVAFLERQRCHAIGRLEMTNKQLQTALSEISTLHGLLPICSYCKQIRTGIGSWIGLEEYVRRQYPSRLFPWYLSKLFEEALPRFAGRDKSRRPENSQLKILIIGNKEVPDVLSLRSFYARSEPASRRWRALFDTS